MRSGFRVLQFSAHLTGIPYRFVRVCSCVYIGDGVHYFYVRQHRIGNGDVFVEAPLFCGTGLYYFYFSLQSITFIGE